MWQPVGGSDLDSPHGPLLESQSDTGVGGGEAEACDNDRCHSVLAERHHCTSRFGETARLAPMGYGFTTTDAGIASIDLSPYEILVICGGSAWDTPYTARQRDEIRKSALGRYGSRLKIVMGNCENAGELVRVVSTAGRSRRPGSPEHIARRLPCSYEPLNLLGGPILIPRTVRCSNLKAMYAFV